MPIGTCRLCQFPNVELRDSHFMSAGFYKIARDESRSNPNPVLMSEQVSMISSEQAKDMPPALRKLCSVRSPNRFILMTPDVDDLNMSDGAKLIAKTRKVGALRKP